MRVVEGYDLSFNSCMYCDYLSGPFAVRTKLLASMADDAFIAGEQFYADLWIRALDNLTILNCPDAMFYTQNSGFFQSMRSDWIPFARKHQLNKLILPPGYDYQYTCEETKTSCGLPLGRMLPLCCLQELTDLLVYTVKEFDAVGIIYELEAGTGVGVVKVGGTLPWERDADFNIRSQNISAAMKLKQKFSKAGYRMVEEDASGGSPHLVPSKCLDSKTKHECGYIAIRSAHWRMEVWGFNWLSNEKGSKLEKDGFPPTRVNYAGYWATGLLSPAASVRNLYNDDIFKHEEHWTTLGLTTGWYLYSPGQFRSCSTPGFHGCFRGNYLPVGNLQFKEVWV